jgi:hypothetical protein
VPPVVVGNQPDVTGRSAAVHVLPRSLDVEQERGERRGPVRADDPEPAPDDVARAQRGAIAEPEVGPELEDHLTAVILETPRLGEGRTQLESGVDRCQRFEELADQRAALRIAGERRVERRRAAGQDARGGGIGRDRRGRPACTGEQGDEQDRDPAAHRAEYTGDPRRTRFAAGHGMRPRRTHIAGGTMPEPRGL